MIWNQSTDVKLPDIKMTAANSTATTRRARWVHVSGGKDAFGVFSAIGNVLKHEVGIEPRLLRAERRADADRYLRWWYVTRYEVAGMEPTDPAY